MIISLIITASKSSSIALGALGEEACREVRSDVLKKLLTIGRVDQVGAGTRWRVKAAGVEVALRHPILW